MFSLAGSLIELFFKARRPYQGCSSAGDRIEVFQVQGALPRFLCRDDDLIEAFEVQEA